MGAEAAVVREARFEDHPEATELLRRLGLGMPAAGKAAEAHWRRLWLDNPATASGRRLPYGWVLEEGGRMVGFFANLAARYRWGEEDLLAAIANQWGVEKEYRTQTNRLCDAYFAQPGADLILVTTAIKPTGRIFLRFGGAVVPQAGADAVRFWVLDPGAFAAAALRKTGRSAGGLLERALAAGVGGWQALRGAALEAPDAEVLSLADVDERFDALWQAADRERLTAWRDGESLRWHYAPHAERGAVWVPVRLRPDGTLAGYAVLVREDAPDLGLKRLKLVDLFCAQPDLETARTLLAAALRRARELGMHVLEVSALPSPYAGWVARWAPLRRRLPVCPFFYRPQRAQDGPRLAREASWHLTGYDGDASLFPGAACAA